LQEGAAQQNNMNIKQKKLKHLAEKYYYGRKKLSNKEREILENSKYKKLLGVERNYSEFDKILENFEETTGVESPEMVQKPVERRSKYFMFHSSLPYIKDLIDEIEDAFFLGLENFGLDRYKNIDINQLREFIKNYVSNNIKDRTLLEEIKKAISRPNAWSIMYNLRMLLSR